MGCCAAAAIGGPAGTAGAESTSILTTTEAGAAAGNDDPLACGTDDAGLGTAGSDGTGFTGTSDDEEAEDTCCMIAGGGLARAAGASITTGFGAEHKRSSSGAANTICCVRPHLVHMMDPPSMVNACGWMYLTLLEPELKRNDSDCKCQEGSKPNNNKIHNTHNCNVQTNTIHSNM